jgi:tetratricopeptide (TPR) repeat protein
MLLECASMRLSVILILLAAVPLAQADVIVLKNGKRIVVDTAREQNGRIQYEVGDNTFAISKNLVDRIEAGAAGGTVPRSQTAPPEFTPNDTITISEDLSTKLVHDGKVDLEMLAALDKSSDQQTAASAYFRAAKFEQDHGNPDKAARYYGLALGHAPNSDIILDHYASLLIQIGRGEEAVSMAERSTRIAPKSGDAWMVLGFAYYAADRDEDAIEAWKKSEEIRPDPTVKKYLAKAQRDKEAQANFQQRDSGHFTIRYEGHRVPDSLSNSILQTLETHYDDFASQFNVSPRTIPVILYTDQAFFDVTQSPSWTGAVNDGKIRIPVSGLTLVTPELSRILRHELAHTFINQISRGKCPQWLHEGIAQVLEGRSSAPYGRILSKLYANDHEVPMYLLESSFLTLDKEEASVAYVQSLAVTEYIRDTYGMDDIRRILQKIGEGSSTEAAVRTTVHSGYSQLEREVGHYLANRYGT